MIRDKSSYYKQKRDVSLTNRPLATFYQILLIREEEKNRYFFHKNSSLEQLRKILDEMLDEVLQIDDIYYQQGICQEVLLAARSLSPSVEEGEICNEYFIKSGICEYVWGAFQIHISGILDMAGDDAEVARIYADNLLTLMEMGYGKNSVPSARMKLHIVGEFLFLYQREEFLCIFREEYDYFREYVMPYDTYYFDVFSSFLFALGEQEDKDCELWMARFEDELGMRKTDDTYCFFQCRAAWLKGKRFEKMGRNRDGFLLLQGAIKKYLEKDSDKARPFYTYVYLMAAYFSMAVKEYEKMLFYAQEGLTVCEKAGLKESEVYYNLYYYIGMRYMREGDWGEAENFFHNAIPELIWKFGKESENYVVYMGYMALIAINRGKDAVPYFDELREIKSEKLRKKCNVLLNNELNYYIVHGVSMRVIEQVYKKCLKNTDGDDTEEIARLDTLYISARIGAGIFDEKTEKLLKELEVRYKNRFSDELALSYWDSRMVWEKSKGNLQNALKIGKYLNWKKKISDDDGEGFPNINYILLLALNGQYIYVKKEIISSLEILFNKVFETGYGNSGKHLLSIRMLISIYIYAIKKGGEKLQVEYGEATWLLEEIFRCKTIEREMKGLMGKFDDGQMDLYYFRQAHRKLAVLEMMHISKDPMKYADSKEKRRKCLLELGEHESGLCQRIPFRELVHEYKLKELAIPHNALCAEYVAYYDLSMKSQMFEEEQEEICYGYLVFILGEEEGRAKILETLDIPFDAMIDEDIGHLLNAVEDPAAYMENDMEDIQCHLHQIFAAPILKYAEGKERLYLGLDYILQRLPTDLIFYYEGGKSANNVLLDSVCYVGEDTYIDITGVNALIIGNPKLRLHDIQEQSELSCGELECNRIAEMLGTKAYIGEEASQKMLWGKKTKDIIHISTHGGYCEPDDMTKVIFRGTPLIYSFLKLAGYEDWAKGERDKNYGNGVVTGDDFLFMDLSKTKLVVLSACASGMGYLYGLDAIHGMRWAISTAGAWNSVTTLWEVSDEATAVLMLLFYRNLCVMPVSEALYQAKMQLRMITRDELNNDKELKQIIEAAQRGRVTKEQYRESEGNCPFSHWKYWAGFVCYHR